MTTTCSERFRRSILGAVGEAAQEVPLPSHIQGNIKVGSFYELDHSKLPLKVPALLHSVRVAMVTSKTEMVSMRYASPEEVKKFIESLERKPVGSRMYPILDQKYVMGLSLAVEVLQREIPSNEWEERHISSFWLINCFETKVPSPVSVWDAAEDSKNGPLLLDLHNRRRQGWGSQCKVVYLRDPNPRDETTSVFASHEDGNLDIKEEEESAECNEQKIMAYSRKRKHVIAGSNKNKKIKLSPKPKPKIQGNKDKECIQRWPVKRYEAAAKELAGVLKANGAVYGNPISRFELRTQARFRIGDTGLLDHLLKHLAGNVVPGEDQRLRRRCDADGKMEYWLESAELAEIRKEAGVQDPYWTPPLGWKPGDCVRAQTCFCSEEVRLLKAEMSNMRRQIEMLKAKDQDDQAAPAALPDTSASSERVDNGALKLKTSMKEIYKALLKRKSIMEEQLRQISKALLELEVETPENQKSLAFVKSDNSADEEMNELITNEFTEYVPEAASGEVSENDDRDQQAENARQMKLKPCEHQEYFSDLPSQAVDEKQEDPMLLVTVSTSPHSTTTSLTIH